MLQEVIYIITLNECKIGEKYIINSVNCTGDLKRRLLDIGFIENTEITPVFRSPFGNPTAYSVRGAIIAIRNEDSNNIMVTLA